MLSQKKILWVGFGQLAQQGSQILIDMGAEVFGVARSVRSQSTRVSMIYGDICTKNVLQNLQSRQYDAVIITMTPDDYSRQGYLKAYYETVKALLEIWQKDPPGQVIFVSSTSVYGQMQGEWVDESSVTAPSSDSAKVLLETEALLRNSQLNSLVIRFSGIYGPGRDFLLRQVVQKRGGSQAYSNRIHSDDCVGVLKFYTALCCQTPQLDEVVIATDSYPEKSATVRQWLAQQLGIDAQQLISSSEGRGGNKRCVNKKLIDAGYRFKFEDYKSGYAQQLEEFKKHNKTS